MLNKIKTLLQHQSFKKYFNNTSWLFAEKIINMVVNFFVGIAIAKYLGPTKLGMLSYAQSFIGLFMAIASMGLNAILVREYLKWKDRALWNAFVLRVIASIIVFLLIVIGINSLNLNNELKNLIIIMGLFPIFRSLNVFEAFFQAKILNKYIVLSNTFALLISACFKIFLIFINADVIWFGVALSFEALILGLGYLYFFFKFNNFNFKIDFRMLKILFHRGKYLIFSTMLVAIYMRTDQIMIEMFINIKSVGIYAIAIKFATIWGFIPGILANLFFASLMASLKNMELFEKKYLMLLKLGIFISLFVIIFMEIFADKLIVVLLGDKYIESVEVLRILLFTFFFLNIGIIGSKWYVLFKLERYILLRSFIGVLLNIILNLYLIKIYGIIGVAWATVISQFFVTFLFDLFNEKTRPLFWLKLKALRGF